MKVYIDITLLPSDDIGHHFLWEKVYQQVHLALVEKQDTNGASIIGIGFPEFCAEKQRLGRKLRVFAPDRVVLDALDIPNWLNRLTDYVHLTRIRDVPDTGDRYERFSRLQVKSKPERLARRAAKRGGISYEEELGNRMHMKPEKTKAPFIWTRSLSNGNRFRLFIIREEFGPEGNIFSAYGLSKGGALPLF